MTNTMFEPINHEFVDRDSIREKYSEITDRKVDQRIFCLHAEDGWGKSWLLARLYLDTPEKNCLKALIDLGSTKVKDEQALLETIADEMGGTVSEEISDVLSTPSGSINIQSGRDVNIKGDVAVNKVVINNQGGSEHLSVELRDSHGYDQHVRTLTRLFMSGLERLPQSTRAFLFLDRFEKATKPTHDWLVDHLFNGLRSGDYPNLIVIVAGIMPFELFEGREWRYTVMQQQLGGLPEESIRKYWLEKRRLPEGDLQTIMKILRTGGFSPSALSTYADIIEKTP